MQFMLSQQARMRSLENQLGELVSVLNNHPHGRLPSDAKVPRQEDEKECKAIELGSGKELPDPYTNKAP